MPIAIPNVSEGRDQEILGRFGDAIEKSGARVLDIHSDAVHNRSVFTVAGPAQVLPPAMSSLALETSSIDLEAHRGAHPRLGGLDVCPIVAYEVSVADAVDIAFATGRSIAGRARLPVYFYGYAARRRETKELPDLRRGGLTELILKEERGLHPDLGPGKIDRRRGVVCVGARGPLIAFNVWLRSDYETAVAIAGRVRSSGGGSPGVRAIGIAMSKATSQISMNLIDPQRTGIDRAFEDVRSVSRTFGVPIEGAEIVGLVPTVHLPNPDAQAARLLIQPGRSLEEALAG